MSNWIVTNPLHALAVAWVAFLFLVLIPFLIRGWRRSIGEDAAEPPEARRDKPELVLTVQDRISETMAEIASRGEFIKRRIPMISRFTPDDAHGMSHDIAMVSQILGDQQTVGAEPGKQTDAPAPGEPGYHAPNERIRVIVGPYTVILDRAYPTTVAEERPNGSTWPMVEVPKECEPVVIALAMEVLRLREGWRVSETDWQPR